MLPFEQGGLDSLCGLYSIVNAERVINNTSNEESLSLFNEVVYYLHKKRMLSSLLIDGMYLKNVKAVLENVVGDRIPYQRIPFAGWPNPDLDEFWREIQRFLAENPHRAVILSLSGIHDHFTVVKGITARQIQLFDSNELYRLNRSNCTTMYATYKRRHILFPAQTYFLGRE
jgi:hypothetical protein